MCHKKGWWERRHLLGLTESFGLNSRKKVEGYFITFGGRGSFPFRRNIQKDLMKLCREKTGRAKAQLEPNQATAITNKVFLQIHQQPKEGHGESSSFIGWRKKH